MESRRRFSNEFRLDAVLLTLKESTIKNDPTIF